jgi:hypothetical protein
MNTPPVIQSISTSSARAEAGAPIQITAVVTDAESPVDHLTCEWAAAPASGSFIGSGCQVNWQAPLLQPTPDLYTLTLKATENYTTDSASSTVQVHYNDSDPEVRKIVSDFLTDFATFSVSPEQAVRNFSDNCPGKADELQDIRENREKKHILSGTFRIDSVMFDSKRTRGFVRAPCTFEDIDNATHVRGTVSGTCNLITIYEAWRWYLCDSQFAPSPKSTARYLFRVP